MKIFQSQHQFGMFLSCSIQAQILGETISIPMILPLSLGPFCGFRCLDMGQGGNSHRASKTYDLRQSNTWARCWPTYIMTKELACGASGYGVGTLWLTQRQLASFGKFYSNWNLRMMNSLILWGRRTMPIVAIFALVYIPGIFYIDNPPLEPGPHDFHTLSLALFPLGFPPISPFYLLHCSCHQAFIPKRNTQDI